MFKGREGRKGTKGAKGGKVLESLAKELSPQLQEAVGGITTA